MVLKRSGVTLTAEEERRAREEKKATWNFQTGVTETTEVDDVIWKLGTDLDKDLEEIVTAPPEAPKFNAKDVPFEDKDEAAGVTAEVKTVWLTVWDNGAVDFTQDNLILIARKDPKTLTQAEKNFLNDIKTKRALGQTTADIFGLWPTEEELKTPRDVLESDLEREKVRKDQSIARARNELEWERSRELDRAQAISKRKQDIALNRGLATGFAASSALDPIFEAVQSDFDRQAQEVNSRFDLLEQRKVAELEGDTAEIDRIQAELDDVNARIKGTETGLARNVWSINAQTGKKGKSALDDLIGSLTTDTQDKLVSKWFDEKASLALWYVSDNLWNPLVTDENGEAIPFEANQFGSEVKVSTFKDTNGNTFVYKNWVLSEIVQNDWTILSGEQVNTAKVPGEIQAAKQDEDRRKTETSLRKEFNNRAEIKRFNSIRGEAQRVEAWFNAAKTGKTWAWDLTMVFAFMKMLDPGSVVREGEFATAANSAWVSESIRNQYNKILTWEFLSPKSRDDFLALSKDLLKTEQSNAQSVADQFIAIADDAGARSEFILSDFSIDKESVVFDNIQDDELSDNEAFFWEETTTTTETVSGNTFKTDTWFEFDFTDFNQADQPAATKVFNNRDVNLWESTLNAFSSVNEEFKAKFGRDIKLGSEATASTRSTKDQQTLFGQGRTEKELITAWFSEVDAKAFAKPDDNIVTNADGIKKKSKHQEWNAIDIRAEDIEKAKPILEKLGFKQTIPKWDAGHFEFIQ